MYRHTLPSGWQPADLPPTSRMAVAAASCSRASLRVLPAACEASTSAETDCAELLLLLLPSVAAARHRHAECGLRLPDTLPKGLPCNQHLECAGTIW